MPTERRELLKQISFGTLSSLSLMPLLFWSTNEIKSTENKLRITEPEKKSIPRYSKFEVSLSSE